MTPDQIAEAQRTARDWSEVRPRHQPTRRSTFATVAASHLPPRAVAMPREFKAAASSRSVCCSCSLGLSNFRQITSAGRRSRL
jgi:hypothetical protein